MKPVKRFVSFAVVCLIATLLLSTRSYAEKTIKVDQIIDLNALSADQIYRFEPNYLWLEPGETLHILNSLGNHTVTSLKGIWPEGVEPVDIAHQANTQLTLTQEGVYGFRCKVHGRHGMYAIVVVGSPEPNRNNIELTNVSRRGIKLVQQLLNKVDEDWKKRSM